MHWLGLGSRLAASLGLRAGSCLLLRSRGQSRLVPACKKPRGRIPRGYSIELVQPPVVPPFLREMELKGSRQHLAARKVEVLVN